MRHMPMLLAILVVAGEASADDGRPPALRNVGIDQRLGQHVPTSLRFANEQGVAISLAECLDDKPSILVLAYYRCPMLCTLVLNGVLDACQRMPVGVGNEFNVITVSFDSQEGPALAAAKKTAYVSRYGRVGAATGWHFLTGDDHAIQALCQAVGFRFAYDAQRQEFAHASGIMVLTPQGQIARYLYGVDYSPRDLRLALVEASNNRIGSAVDQILLFCYHYDPAAGTYTASVMSWLRIAGAATLISLGLFLISFIWRRSRYSGPRQGPPVQGATVTNGQPLESVRTAPLREPT